MRIYFFGTHDFAKHILSALIADENIEIVGVVTQPDRPAGRKNILQASPVKLLAEQHNLQIFQPETLKHFEITDTIDIGVVAQYGNLIPKRLLDHPRLGMINVHTSLLPTYRGASPIQTALINGDTTTGVTIMTMDVGLDTGDILKQQEIAIDSDWVYSDLDNALATISAPLLLDVLHQIISGTIIAKKQDDTLATHCAQLTRDSGMINWDNSAETIYNQYRGLTPWPGIWTMWQGKRLKLLKISKISETHDRANVLCANDQIIVGTSQGSIVLHTVQLEGKASMDSKVFISGYKEFCTAKLGK